MKTGGEKIVIVGAGMSGLTAAIYLSQQGYNVLLIDKNKECGGLLTSFEYEGFTFDGGARSIENSGIIRPMLNELGIDLEILESPVSIGIEDEIVNTFDLKCAPNPATTSANITISLNTAARAGIDIFNSGGHLVKSIADLKFAQGQHAFSWDLRNNSGNRLPAGIYYIRLKTSGGTLTRAVSVLP